MSAHIIEFMRGGQHAQLRIETPIESTDVDRLFTLLAKLQRLHRQNETASRVIERTIDDLLEPRALVDARATRFARIAAEVRHEE
jgi:hypothetical protein